MYVSEAMEIIEIVLCNFIKTNYSFESAGEEETAYCLEKIRIFIRDDEGYWVTNKVILIIDDLLDFNENHSELPPSLDKAVDAVLEKVADAFTEIINEYRDGDIFRVHFLPPSLDNVSKRLKKTRK